MSVDRGATVDGARYGTAGRTVLAALSFVFLLCAPCYAAPTEGSPFFRRDRPIDIEADALSYDRESDTYLAEGNVVVTQGLTRLSADKMMINMSSGAGLVAGDVRGTDEAGNSIECDSISFNVNDETAVVLRGRFFYREMNVYITGEEIRKVGEQTYTATESTFTSCDCEEGEEPAWSFHLSRAKVTFGEFLTGRNAFFRVKGYPLLYSPYVIAPVNRKRQTGFLTPVPGYSRLRGAVLGNSFFWAMAGNMDATFYLDVESRRGLGKGFEFRHKRTRRSEGEFYFYHYKERDITRVRRFRSAVDNLRRPQSATDDRWEVKLRHRESLAGGVRLKADIHMVSDDEYFIDFGRDALMRSRESLESTVSLTKQWAAYSLVAELRYFDNLLLADDDTVLQRLPEVSFRSPSRDISGTPLRFSLDSAYVNFHRRKGLRGDRIDLNPRLSLPLRPGGWFEFTPSVGPRLTWYSIDDRDVPGVYDRESFRRYLYDVRGVLTTTFVRIFKPGFEVLRKVRHTVRPKLVYVYIPDVDQSRLPRFDSLDRVAAANRITYSLNNTVTGRFEKDGRKRYLDFLYFDISQSYDIGAARRPAVPGVKKQPFSDVTAEVILRPMEAVEVSARALYDVYERALDKYDITAGYGDAYGNALSLNYRFRNTPPGSLSVPSPAQPSAASAATSAAVLDSSRRYAEVYWRLRLADPVALSYRNRYSFDAGKSLETDYGAEYMHQCWGVKIEYRDLLEEQLVMLTFSLKGLGEVGGIKGRFEGK